MKAVIINEYGNSGVLNYTDIPMPKLAPDQALVRVHYAGINPLDCKIRAGELKMLTGKVFPKTLGVEATGEIVELGKSISGYRVGDKVLVFTMEKYEMGAYAEYMVGSAKNMVKLDPDVDMPSAAAISVSAVAALQSLRDLGKMKPGQSVLINGASGGVGAAAVQIAKEYGAKVTAVCGPSGMALMKTLRADYLIDYTKEDFTGVSNRHNRYDIIFDCVAKKSFKDCKPLLTGSGIYIDTNPKMPHFIFQKLTNKFKCKKNYTIAVKPNALDLNYLLGLMKNGKFSVNIDRRFKLQDIKLAHDYQEGGKAQGKLLFFLQ